MSEIGDALRELADLADWKIKDGPAPRIDVEVKAHGKAAGRKLMQLAKRLKHPGTLNGGRRETYSWQTLERRLVCGCIHLTWYDGAIDPIAWGFFGKPLELESKEDTCPVSGSPLQTE